MTKIIITITEQQWGALTSSPSSRSASVEYRTGSRARAARAIRSDMGIP